MHGIASGASRLPETLVRGGLSAFGPLATRTRAGEHARANLALALGDEIDLAGREQLVRAMLRHNARLGAEWLRLSRGNSPPHDSQGWIDERVTIDPSIEHLDRVLALGRGAIVVTAHIGNWELLAAALHRRGHGGAVVGRHNRRDPASHWLIEMRRAYGVTTLPQDSSPRELLRVLESGAVLGILCDLEVRRLDGEFVDFFGIPALTMTAPAALARVARTPLVPVRCTRRRATRPGSGSSLSLPAASANGPYELRAEEPLHYERSPDRKQDARVLLKRLNELYERWIRETPEQWAWHHLAGVHRREMRRRARDCGNARLEGRHNTRTRGRRPRRAHRHANSQREIGVGLCWGSTIHHPRMEGLLRQHLITTLSLTLLGTVAAQNSLQPTTAPYNHSGDPASWSNGAPAPGDIWSQLAHGYSRTDGVAPYNGNLLVGHYSDGQSLVYEIDPPTERS